MKLAISLLFAASLFGQETKPIIVPSGNWVICEDPQLSSFFGGMCTGFQPGHESYVLLIPDNSYPVLAYQWTVTATLLNGQVVTLSGVTQRAQGNAWTSVPLDFGGAGTLQATIQYLFAGPVLTTN